jgi:hypothetical protein
MSSSTPSPRPAPGLRASSNRSSCNSRHVPHGILIDAVARLAIVGAFTIVDFNRLRRSTPDAALPIAANIFLHVFNVFLLALDLFGGRRG